MLIRASLVLVLFSLLDRFVDSFGSRLSSSSSSSRPSPVFPSFAPHQTHIRPPYPLSILDRARWPPPRTRPEAFVLRRRCRLPLDRPARRELRPPRRSSPPDQQPGELIRPHTSHTPHRLRHAQSPIAQRSSRRHVLHELGGKLSGDCDLWPRPSSDGVATEMDMGGERTSAYLRRSYSCMAQPSLRARLPCRRRRPTLCCPDGLTREEADGTALPRRHVSVTITFPLVGSIRIRLTLLLILVCFFLGEAAGVLPRTLLLRLRRRHHTLVRVRLNRSALPSCRPTCRPRPCPRRARRRPTRRTNSSRATTFSTRRCSS